MKKLLVLPIIFVLALSMALAASVSRDMPSRVDPGSEVQVTLTLNGATAGEGVAIEDTIPNAITIKSWEVSGSQEAKDAVSYQQKASQKEGFSRNSWAFTAASTSPSITYKFDAPAVGSYEFDVRWITKEGFSHAASTLAVRTITCGDGACEGDENSDNCIADCPRAAEAPPTPVEPKALEAPGKAPIAWIIAAVVVILGIILIAAYQKKKQQA